ncbi:MAG TPA: PepSY domain-containing protein [Verrucomicrobiae bacterium]|nr:PepSY domain-containing protein [Verrucomicrobiae bacterium]
MKPKNILISACAGLLFASLTATAQETPEMLNLRIRGSCQTTNENGNLIKQPLSNRTILREWADKNGVTNRHSLALVYHVKGDERGDVIEIVDAHTGEILQPWLGIFFPVELSNPDDTKTVRLSELFNSQQSTEMGFATLKDRPTNKKHADHIISGDLNFYLTPDKTNGLRICAAKIMTLKTFTPKPLPPTPPGTNSPAGDTGE